MKDLETAVIVNLFTSLIPTNDRMDDDRWQGPPTTLPSLRLVLTGCCTE